MYSTRIANPSARVAATPHTPANSGWAANARTTNAGLTTGRNNAQAASIPPINPAQPHRFFAGIEPKYSLLKFSKLGNMKPFMHPYPNDAISDYMLGFRRYGHDKGVLAHVSTKNINQFFANFKLNSYSASALFPTDIVNPNHPELPLVNLQTQQNFENNPLLVDSQRKALGVALHYFGLRRRGDAIGYLPAILSKPPAWLREDGHHDRLLLTRMIRSLALLGNQQVAKNLAMKVAQLLAHTGMIASANAFFIIGSDIQVGKRLQVQIPAPAAEPFVPTPAPSTVASTAPVPSTATAPRQVPPRHALDSSVIKIGKNIALGSIIGDTDNAFYMQDAYDKNYCYKVIPSHTAPSQAAAPLGEIQSFNAYYGQNSCVPFFYDLTKASDPVAADKLTLACHATRIVKDPRKPVKTLWLLKQKRLPGIILSNLVRASAKLPNNIGIMLGDTVNKVIQSGNVPANMSLDNFVYDHATNSVHMLDLTPSGLSAPTEQYNRMFIVDLLGALKEAGYMPPGPPPLPPWMTGQPQISQRPSFAPPRAPQPPPVQTAQAGATQTVTPALLRAAMDHDMEGIKHCYKAAEEHLLAVLSGHKNIEDQSFVQDILQLMTEIGVRMNAFTDHAELINGDETLLSYYRSFLLWSLRAAYIEKMVLTENAGLFLEKDINCSAFIKYVGHMYVRNAKVDSMGDHAQRFSELFSQTAERMDKEPAYNNKVMARLEK